MYSCVCLSQMTPERIVLGAAREIYRWRIQRPPEELPAPPSPNEVVLPIEPGTRWVASVREEPFE